MTSKWQRTDVDATSLRRIDISTTSFLLQMPAWLKQKVGGIKVDRYI